jgi:hypothetical protein
MKAYERAIKLLRGFDSGDPESVKAFQAQAPDIVEGLIMALSLRPTPLVLAKRFYAAYGKLASRYHCDPPVGWDEEPANQRELMVAVCRDVLGYVGGDCSSSEETLAILERCNPEAEVLFGLEEAIIGIVDTPDRPPELAYDFGKSLKLLAERHGISEHEAAQRLGEMHAVFLHRT